MTTTMKKIFAILCAASALLISCTKVAPEAQEIETGNAAGKIQVNIAVSREGDTKAVKTGWEKGDVIYVFFNNLTVSTPPKYLTLTFDGNGWDNTWYGDADADLLTMSTGTMTAVYFPFHSGQVTIAQDGDNYTFKNGTENIYSYYMKCENAEYSVSAGVLTGTLAMAIPGASTGHVVQLYIPDENPVAGKYALTVRCKDGSNENYRSKGAVMIDNNLGKIVEGTEYEPGSSQAEDEIKATVKTTGEGKGYYFYAYEPYESYSSVKFRYYLRNITDDKFFVLFTNQTSLSGAIQLPALSERWVEYVPYSFNVESVDYKIGVATKNIYAETPEDTGAYFAWGETVPKGIDFSWTNYKWAETVTYNSSTNDWDVTFNKYYASDGKTVLEPQDDAATVILGSPWRTPTKNELRGIIGNSNVTYSTGSITLRKKGTNRSIILPVTHQAQDNRMDDPWWYNSTESRAERKNVFLWSSTLSEDYTGAYVFEGCSINNPSEDYYQSVSAVHTAGRRYGMPIRPVFSIDL